MQSFSFLKLGDGWEGEKESVELTPSVRGWLMVSGDWTVFWCVCRTSQRTSITCSDVFRRNFYFFMQAIFYISEVYLSCNMFLEDMQAADAFENVIPTFRLQPQQFACDWGTAGKHARRRLRVPAHKSISARFFLCSATLILVISALCSVERSSFWPTWNWPVQNYKLSVFQECRLLGYFAAWPL
jgi:hypothetical protein